MVHLADAMIRLLPRTELEAAAVAISVELLIRVVVVALVKTDGVALGMAGRGHAEGLVSGWTYGAPDPYKLLTRRGSTPIDVYAISRAACVALFFLGGEMM